MRSAPVRRGRRNGEAGVISARSSTSRPGRLRSAIAATAAEQVHVDEQRAAADDLQQLVALDAAAPDAASPASLAQRRRAALAAMRETDDRRADDEAAGRDSRRLDGG